jgi:hypothetical protein
MTFLLLLRLFEAPVLSIARRTVVPLTSCPANFDLIDGACYRLLSSQQDWIGAEITAAGQSAHLASFATLTEHNSVFTYYRNLGRLTADVWIGLNDVSQEGVFAWTDNSTSTLRNFAQGQPNNDNGDQHCVSVERNDFLWNDVPCLAARLPLLKWDEAFLPFTQGMDPSQ